MVSSNVENMIPKMQEFFRAKSVKKAWLYGSCSRGEETVDSISTSLWNTTARMSGYP